jgi:hypothetical protein
VAASVRRVELPGLHDKGDVSDWLGLAGNDKDRLLALAGATPVEPTSEAPPPAANPADKPHVRRRSFDQIHARPVQWLVQDRIPLGKVVILDGDPGLGKSTLLLDLAARVTGAGGGLFADGTPLGATGNVLIMSAEDDPEDTIRPRLELAGARLDRVHFLDEGRVGGTAWPIEIPRHLPLIEEQIAAVQARLLVIDPLMAYLAGVDANTDQSVRKALAELSRVAGRQKCTVGCQRHLNKGAATKAMYRGGGSIAIIAHARAALLVAPDPDDDSKRLLAVVKGNRSARAATLRFVLEPVSVTIAGKPDVICRVGWCGTSAYEADQLTKHCTAEEKEEQEQARTKLDTAKQILGNLLRLGPLAVKKAKAETAEAGISLRVLERAAHELRLQITYRTDPENGRRNYYYQAPGSPSEGGVLA